MPKRSQHIDIGSTKTCACSEKHLNCLSAKEWIKSQLGVWRFFYEKRDIRDKTVHPATFPIALAAKLIELFTHQGELVVDPFNGSGATLVAAADLGRNAVGFDISPAYCQLSDSRLPRGHKTGNPRQLTLCADARHILDYLPEHSISLSLPSPPYANLLNRKRLNKSRRGNARKNGQYLKVEQYSQQENDLGTLAVEEYEAAMTEIYRTMLPLMKPRGDVIINIADMWWEGQRIPLHLSIVRALQNAGYIFKNTVIWDRTNIVKGIGIFGWPSNYITMGTTFEYLLHFYRPEK